jgi:hypothetical protein
VKKQLEIGKWKLESRNWNLNFVRFSPYLLTTEH